MPPETDSVYLQEHFPWLYARVPYWVYLVFFLSLAVLYHYCIHGELGGIGGDNAYYIAHAINMANHADFRNIIYTDPVSVNNLLSSDSYLCGAFSITLPIFLIPGVLGGKLNFYYFHFVIYVFSLLAPVLTILYFNQRVGQIRSLIYTMLFATSHLYLIYMMDILTENIFITLIMASFLCGRQYAKSSRLFSPWLFALLSCCLFATITRRIGLIVPPCIALSLLLRGAGRENCNFILSKFILYSFFFSLVFTLYMIPWLYILSNFTEGFSSSAGHTLNYSLSGIGDNFSYLRKVARIFLYQGHAISGSMPQIGAFILLLILVSLLYKIFTVHYSSEWYFVFSIIFLLYWKGKTARYLIPLIPFLNFYFFEGLFLLMNFSNKLIGHNFSLRTRRWIGLSILGFITSVFMCYHVVGIVKWLQVVTSQPEYVLGKALPLPKDNISINWSKFREVHSWRYYHDGPEQLIIAQEFLDLNKKASEISRPNDYIMSVKQRITYIFTHKKSTLIPGISDPDDFIDFLKVYNTNLLISSKFYEKNTKIIENTVGRYPNCFIVLWTSPIRGGKIYRFNHECETSKPDLENSQQLIIP